jgi:dTDP-4-dehydrorhamnose 3,5-epimerase
MTARFDIHDTPIPGLKEIARKPRVDARGYFERFFCQDELRELLAGRSVVQINHSLTSLAGTVRGMHYQMSPHAETKIVSCVRGAVFDVAVDIRHGSPTFLQWYSTTLSADNHRTLVIPEGFAHGFQSLSEHSELLYLCTTAYAPTAEMGLSPTDPALAIKWPLTIAAISDRDRNQQLIGDAFQAVSV